MIGCKQAIVPAVVALSVLVGCSKDRKAPGDTHRQNTTAVAAAAPLPGADRDFLRAMSDHHKGLVAIVHATVDRKEKLSVRADANRLDAEQDKELDEMVTMLEKTYKDPYDPKIMPEHQAMLDSLKTLHGSAYDRAFLRDIIRHHEEAVAMIDAFLPKSRDPAVRSMAERMRAAQSREIAEFKKQLGTR